MKNFTCCKKVGFEFIIQVIFVCNMFTIFIIDNKNNNILRKLLRPEHFVWINYPVGSNVIPRLTYFVFHRGHPHSTYAQKGRGGVKTNAYDCVQGGGGSNFGDFCAYVLCGWPLGLKSITKLQDPERQPG